MPESRLFLLSPARCDGLRARTLLNPVASFELARRLRSSEGAPLGAVFSFLSGLYFRGKLEYALALTSPARHDSDIRIITTNRGLLPVHERVTGNDLVAFGDVDIARADERYVLPLRRDAEDIARTAPAVDVVLLGSIATGKYVDTLLDVFGERLLFPAEFVGRGDMSRGGLLLRHARDASPLEYIPVIGARRRGKRPPKLEPLRPAPKAKGPEKPGNPRQADT